MDSQRKPATFPDVIEPDDEEDDEAPKSTLPEPVVEREAAKAIEEIEEEMEEEHPSKPVMPPPSNIPRQSFLAKAWDVQYKVENRLKRIGHGRYGRVIKMARKPEPDEFAKASQITGIGIMVVGAIGFLIFLLVQFIMTLLNVT